MASFEVQFSGRKSKYQIQKEYTSSTMEQQKPSIIVYYCHGGGFVMGSPYFYMEFLMAWDNIVETSRSDISYSDSASIDRLQACSESSLRFVKNRGSWRLSWWHIDHEFVASVYRSTAISKPNFQILLYSSRHGLLCSRPIIEIRHPTTSTPTLLTNMLCNILEDQPLQTIRLCRLVIVLNLARWRRSAPKNGIYFIYGSEEVFAPEIKSVRDTLQKSGISLLLEQPQRQHLFSSRKDISQPTPISSQSPVPSRTSPLPPAVAVQPNVSLQANPVDPGGIMQYGYPGPIADLRNGPSLISAFDRRTRNPHFAAEHFTPASLLIQNGDRRHSQFVEDTSIPEKFRAKLSDYFRSGYDRGHQVPAADAKWSQQAMDVTGPLYLPKKEADGKWRVSYEVVGHPPNVAQYQRTSSRSYMRKMEKLVECELRASGLEFASLLPPVRRKQLCREVSCSIIVKQYAERQRTMRTPPPTSNTGLPTSNYSHSTMMSGPRSSNACI
ncbi:hypothetical protein MRB53_041698 [Persea americana]|nr:hypothetical protein MRB53_041698 [Persea americana]